MRDKLRQRMYKSNVKRPNTCDCIIKRIVRGLLNTDSYLYEVTYDLILTYRNLLIGDTVMGVRYVSCFSCLLELQKMKINMPKLCMSCFPK